VSYTVHSSDLRRNAQTLREGTPVEKTLADQIQVMMKTLAVAESQAATIQATMHESRIFLGLEYDFIQEDIAHVTGKLRHMKLLAEHHTKASRN
jgi:hypothetical protein